MRRFRFSFYLYIRFSQLQCCKKLKYTHPVCEHCVNVHAIILKPFGLLPQYQHIIQIWGQQEYKSMKNCFLSFYLVCLFLCTKTPSQWEWPWESNVATSSKQVMILISIINGYKRLCHSLQLIFNLVDREYFLSVNQSMFQSMHDSCRGLLWEMKYPLSLQ